MNNMPQTRALTSLCTLIIACQLNSVYAAPAPVEVKPNDTLSGIVLLAYPEYGNRPAAMQAILEKNPDAFINNDIHRLIVGKTIQFPDVSELPVAAPREQIQEPAGANTETNQETLQQLQLVSGERDRLNATIKELEAENASLKAKLSELESLKLEQDKQLEQLDIQIKEVQAVAKNQTSQSDTISRESLEKQEQLEAQITGLKDKISELETQLVDQQQNTQSAAADKETLQQQLNTLRSQQSTSSSQLQEQLETLQQKLNSASTEKETLQQQLNSASTEKETLQQQLDTLKSQQSTSSSQLQEQLETLQTTSDTLKSDNSILQKELETIQEQFNASSKEAESLKADLDILNQKNAELVSELQSLSTHNTDLQGALDASIQENTALQNDISQIKASAANDVLLLKEKQSLQSQNPLWPWLLALFLLPVAWLLGRRSRPSTAQDIVTTDPEVPVDATPEHNLTTATNDPVIPTALPGEFDNVTSLHPTVIPDDPDTAIKLDMARAYLDLRDSEAANDILREVLREGGTQQQQEAKEILSFIS